MERWSQKVTETESERESDCRWVADRWASGQVRQVDSGKPLSLLSLTLQPSPLLQLETADVG